MGLTQQPKIVVIGPGYVGLPLAVALARRFERVGAALPAGPPRHSI